MSSLVNNVLSMGWSYLKIFIIAITICLCGQVSLAQSSIKMAILPVNVLTGQSSYGIYPNISEFVASDIANELSQQMQFNIIEPKTGEGLIRSYGLERKYKKFLKNYKDKRVIDYHLCGILQEKLGINKIMLVSANFDLQNMVLKRPLLYRLGFTEIEPIKSSYTLNVDTVVVDTQTGLIELQKTYQRDIRTDKFGVTTSSLSDNMTPTKEMRYFTQDIAANLALRLNTDTQPDNYAVVRSNIIKTKDRIKESMEDKMTRDGHPFMNKGVKYLNDKRKESFKNWSRDNAAF